MRRGRDEGERKIIREKNSRRELQTATSSLQHQRHASEESTRQRQQAKSLPDQQRRRSPARSTLRSRALLCRATVTRRRSATETGENRLAVRVGGGARRATRPRSRSRSRHGPTDGGRVGFDGVLGAAGVLFAAVGGAGIVGAAGGHALVAPFLADEEGEGLGVLGDVGAQAVGAFAVVGQVVRVTVVGCGGVGGFGGGLEAD